VVKIVKLYNRNSLHSVKKCKILVKKFSILNGKNLLKKNNIKVKILFGKIQTTKSTKIGKILFKKYNMLNGINSTKMQNFI
jgi:hypothetical protein